MLPVVVCVGSSCYVRGSEAVAETFERLVREQNLMAGVEVTGAFCMDQCSMGVSVHFGEHTYRGVLLEEAEEFFRREIQPQMIAFGDLRTAL